MKKFTVAYFKKLLGYVSAEQISFGRMCELINQDIEKENTKSYNQAINDVDNLIDNHEEEVYIGVINDILKLKNSTIVNYDKDLLGSFIQWLKTKDDVFYAFDNTDDVIEEFIKIKDNG